MKTNTLVGTRWRNELDNWNSHRSGYWHHRDGVRVPRVARYLPAEKAVRGLRRYPCRDRHQNPGTSKANRR